jgi:hypothetical protein
MLLDARNDLFEFQFPKTFFPQEIRDKWVKYVRRAPSPIQEVPEFLNFTIQGVNTSSLSYDPAEQSHTQRKRQERKWRSSAPIGQTSSKELSVTFQLIDGYANYFLLMELFDYWYDFYNTENYCPTMTLFTVDGDGNRLMQFVMKDVLFTNMQELQLNYSDNVQQFNSFDATFVFNSYEIKFPFD